MGRTDAGDISNAIEPYELGSNIARSVEELQPRATLQDKKVSNATNLIKQLDYGSRESSLSREVEDVPVLQPVLPNTVETAGASEDSFDR